MVNRDGSEPNNKELVIRRAVNEATAEKMVNRDGSEPDDKEPVAGQAINAAVVEMMVDGDSSEDHKVIMGCVIPEGICPSINSGQFSGVLTCLL